MTMAGERKKKQYAGHLLGAVNVPPTPSVLEEPENSCHKLTLAALALTWETSHGKLSQIYPLFRTFLPGLSSE